MLDTVFQRLEVLINGALEHDPSSQQRVAALAGKVLALHIQDFNRTLIIQPMPHGVELSSNIDDFDVDMTLSASIKALVAISRDGIENVDLPKGAIDIQGDPIIGQRFAQLIAELDIDWNSLLAEHIGETPAAFVSQGLQQAQNIAQRGKAVATEKLQHFIKDEVAQFADKQQTEEFLQSVDTLKSDVDRLLARIKRLQKNT